MSNTDFLRILDYWTHLERQSTSLANRIPEPNGRRTTESGA